MYLHFPISALKPPICQDVDPETAGQFKSYCNNFIEYNDKNKKMEVGLQIIIWILSYYI